MSAQTIHVISSIHYQMAFRKGQVMFHSIKQSLTTPHLSKTTQSAFTCSKLTIETLEQDVEYVQS